VKTSEDLQYVEEAAELAYHYLAEVRRIAPTIGMRRGQLSKAILPYGETTSTLEQAHSENLPEMQVLTDAGLTERQVRGLVHEATTCRKLVRVKIADDQDLDQAESAVQELRTFLTGLRSYADSKGESNFAVLQQLN